MTESAWFNLEHAPLFSLVALVSLLSLLEIPAERGRYRFGILSVCVLIIAGGLGMLLAAIHARSAAQPAYVILTLTTGGGLLTFAGIPALIRMIALYRREAERGVASHVPRQPFSRWQ